MQHPPHLGLDLLLRLFVAIAELKPDFARLHPAGVADELDALRHGEPSGRTVAAWADQVMPHQPDLVLRRGAAVAAASLRL